MNPLCIDGIFRQRLSWISIFVFPYRNAMGILLQFRERGTDCY